MCLSSVSTTGESLYPQPKTVLFGKWDLTPVKTAPLSSTCARHRGFGAPCPGTVHLLSSITPYSMIFSPLALILVTFVALLPVVEGGPAGLFPLLKECTADINLEVLLCGTVMAFDVSLLAMTDITGAFAKSFAAGNLDPLVAKWRRFLLGFVAMGCTPFLVFDSNTFTFDPKVETQQTRRNAREKYVQELARLRMLAGGLSGAALAANLLLQESALKKTLKYSPALQIALIDLAVELGLPYTVAPSQADVQMVQLVVTGVCDLLFSGDGDCLVHGAVKQLTHIDVGRVGRVVDLSIAPKPTPGVVDNTSLTDLFFYDGTRRPRLEVQCILRWYSVLAGCDYVKHKGVSSVTAVRSLYAAGVHELEIGNEFFSESHCMDATILNRAIHSEFFPAATRAILPQIEARALSALAAFLFEPVRDVTTGAVFSNNSWSTTPQVVVPPGRGFDYAGLNVSCIDSATGSKGGAFLFNRRAPLLGDTGSISTFSRVRPRHVEGAHYLDLPWQGNGINGRVSQQCTAPPLRFFLKVRGMVGYSDASKAALITTVMNVVESEYCAFRAAVVYPSVLVDGALGQGGAVGAGLSASALRSDANAVPQANPLRSLPLPASFLYYPSESQPQPLPPLWPPPGVVIAGAAAPAGAFAVPTWDCLSFTHNFKAMCERAPFLPISAMYTYLHTLKGAVSESYAQKSKPISMGSQRALDMTSKNMESVRMYIRPGSRHQHNMTIFFSAEIPSTLGIKGSRRAWVELDCGLLGQTYVSVISVVHGHCEDCVAGSGGYCYHVFAVLFIVHCLPLTSIGAPTPNTATTGQCRWRNGGAQQQQLSLRASHLKRSNVDFQKAPAESQWYQLDRLAAIGGRSMCNPLPPRAAAASIYDPAATAARAALMDETDRHALPIAEGGMKMSLFSLSNRPFSQVAFAWARGGEGGSAVVSDVEKKRLARHAVVEAQAARKRARAWADVDEGEVPLDAPLEGGALNDFFEEAQKAFSVSRALAPPKHVIPRAPLVEAQVPWMVHHPKVPIPAPGLRVSGGRWATKASVCGYCGPIQNVWRHWPGLQVALERKDPRESVPCRKNARWVDRFNLPPTDMPYK